MNVKNESFELLVGTLNTCVMTNLIGKYLDQHKHFHSNISAIFRSNPKFNRKSREDGIEEVSKRVMFHQETRM